MNIIRYTILLLLFPFLSFSSLNFVHIPKCAGTTIDELIKQKIHYLDIYPFRVIERCPTWSDIENPEEYVKDYPDIRQKYVSGHLPYWFYVLKDPNFQSSFFFTCLRDPIARVLSQYRYSLKFAKGPFSISSIPGNYMCKMLCSDPNLRGEELLRNSIQNLEKMDFILFQDDLHNGLQQLFAALNFEFPTYGIPHKNTTVNNEKFSEAVLKELREKNDLDIRLYEYANKNLRNRVISNTSKYKILRGL